MMISKFTSNKYTNLIIFLSVDKHFWSSQGYHFQFMTHMEEEANMMIHNITPVIIFNDGDDVRTYFSPEAVDA